MGNEMELCLMMKEMLKVPMYVRNGRSLMPMNEARHGRAREDVACRLSSCETRIGCTGKTVGICKVF
jgi:hypothetical protein